MPHITTCDYFNADPDERRAILTTPDMVTATTHATEWIRERTALFAARGPRPWHRADGPADETPRTTHGKRVGRTHYGDPLDDKHEEWRAAHRNRAPRHRSIAFDMTRTTNA